MCIKNAMELSLNGDTFSALKDDFDSILAQTLGNMESKGADEAVITLKLGITLEKQSFVRNDEPEELVKPSFKHDISSVMQVKNKKSGSLSGDYELVWDDEEQKYVMRKITNGQITLFDVVESVENEVDEIERYEEYGSANSTSPAMLEAIAQGERNANAEAFNRLTQFVDKKMRISEAMGNYTVRTEDGNVVLTSASAPDSLFHCDAEILAKHIGHNVRCAGICGEDLCQITIECEDCLDTLFSMRLYSEDEDVSEEFNEHMSEDEYDGYDYTEPEEVEGE